MMKDYDIIIAGAGPGGVFAALWAKTKGARVLLLERNTKPCRKLMLSGNGQCNITHEGDVGDFIQHYGKKGSFLRSALTFFPNDHLIKFFGTRGVPLLTREDGKVFPRSLDAEDLSKALLGECVHRRVEMRVGERIRDVSHIKRFLISTDKRSYTSSCLVIATGGKTYPQTGSTGDGYRFAVELGHSIVDPAPALAPLYIQNHPFRDQAGIVLMNVGVSITRDGKRIAKDTGDVLLTHLGVSGPTILNLSRLVKEADRLMLDLTGGMRSEVEFQQALAAYPRQTLKNALARALHLPDRVVERLVDASGMEKHVSCSNLPREGRKRLFEILRGVPLTVKQRGDFSVAMVTQGGIRTDEIDPQSMESRLVPGLFFAGEVIDIDGDTGGYNLQAACSTGALAGKAAASGLSIISR
jgi:predicted Rossmann fold flavoprotein